MAVPSNKMISDFSAKPTTGSFYRAVDECVMSLGPVTREHRSQVSYSVNRKFLWMWAYERTGDGTLYLNVTLDHRQDDEHIHSITQVSPHRWNHHVVVRSLQTATSQWLRALISAGVEFSSR